MPDTHNKIPKFRSELKRPRIPFSVYADVESLLEENIHVITI